MLLDYRRIPQEQVKTISPQSLIEYAKARGWKRVQTKNQDIAVYSHPDSNRLEQLLIPRDSTLDDYVERIYDAIVKLATCENRSDSFEVYQDILTQNSDTLRFVWEGPDTASGSIGFLSGVDFLEGAKRSLLSSACSVITPSTYHPRLSRSEADQLLTASRLNHTQRGSFVISISCPLDAVDTEPSSPKELPFTRQVTELLMRSLHSLVVSIESDQVDSLFQNRDQAPLLSANLCDAILRMQVEQIESLRLGVSWASSLPQPDESVVPRSVRIRREYTNIIERVRDRLRPPTQPESHLFVGTVETLNGAIGSDGRRSGEVTLRVMHEDELVRVRIDLGPEQYAQANTAHMAGSFVQIQGILSPGKRVHRITHLDRFTLLESTPTND